MNPRKPISNQHHPPRWAQRFIEWYCQPALAEDLMGDLHEYFQRNLASKGPLRAKLIYIIDTFKFLRSYTVRTPDPIDLFINWIMLGSHIKTAARHITRNKLFSTINIAGLAIGMSGSLLLIAFAQDLRSYDRFNVKGNSIYRITSSARFRQGYTEKFASTSVRIGKLVEEQVPGIEAAAVIRTEFAGEAETGGNVFPLTGIYASPSLLRMFTWPMLKGDATTALREPYSIVLTETSAKRLFGTAEAFGKTLHIDSTDYLVTGIIQDIPFFSHIQFESLVSFSTIEPVIAKDPGLLQWANVWQRNYLYLLLPENASAGVQAQLDAICARENKADNEAVIRLTLLPLYDIVLGEDLSNSVGPVVPGKVLWIVAGLAFIVILSACFNYTNLSIARSMRRFKEVGLRKVIGAGKGQVRQQFLAEAMIVSLMALLFSFGIFLALRPLFFSMAPQLMKMVKLEITTPMAGTFIAFALAVGIVAGLLPAVFFARVTVIHALKDGSSVKLFERLSFRRALVVVQYTLTLIFMTSTIIGYVQYKKILAFDLGFKTANILNIDLQGNKPAILIDQLKALPEVTGISQSKIVTSVGNAWGGFVKYKSSPDSLLVFTNLVDENYLPLHEYQLIAGQNFITRPLTKDATGEVIVNEKTLKLLNIDHLDPQKAIGEEIYLNNHLVHKKHTIVGVMKDFHYGKLDEDVKPVVFTYLTPDAFIRADKWDGLLNVRISSAEPIETMTRIQEVWRTVDPVHPFTGQFYDNAIEEAYQELSAMIKVIGFLSFIAVSIASLGLLGMVVYTTESRLKEISVRKVLGATSGNLVLLLSRGFIVLLAVSALIALPVTYLFFENVVLTRFPFHDPIGMTDLFAGLLAVLAIAFVMIGSQTYGAAQRNPSGVLKSE